MITKITDNLKKLLDNLGQNKFSLLYLFPKDTYAFEKFNKKFENNLENSVVVQTKNKFNILERSFKLISPQIFKEKKTELYEKTKNAVVIWEKDFNELKGLQAYFPVLYIGNIENQEDFKEKFKDDLEDWKDLYFQNEKLMVLVNRNIKNIDSFVFKDFDISKAVKTKQKIEEEKTMIKNLGVDIEYDSKPQAVEKLQPNNYINYEIFKLLPKPSIKPANRRDIKWCQQFYSYILALLEVIVPPEKERLIKYIINKDTMKTWLTAFTHFTSRPDTDENYDTLEALGDTILKCAFKNYYLRRFPYADQAILNNVSQTSQSDAGQIELGSHMGLINWVDSHEIVRDNKKLNEDLLESFAGAVDYILAEQGQGGLSVSIFMNMYELLYKDYTFDTSINAPTWLEQIIPQIAPENLKMKKTSPTRQERLIEMPRPKTLDHETYKEILQKANQIIQEEGIEGKIVDEIPKQKTKDFGIVIKESITANKKYKAEVIINDYGSKVFKLYGFNFKAGQVIATATDPTKKPAKNIAAKKAKDFLYKHGITIEWVKTQKQNKLIKDLGDLEEKAILKAKQMYPDIHSLGVKSKSLTSDSVFILYGSNKEDTKKYFLVANIGSDKDTSNYKALVEKFLNLRTK